MPPVTGQADCPPISVLTLTYNRRNFIELAFLNLLVTDYPKNKIQWVVVEDSDDPSLTALDKIKQFEERQPGIEITYVPMTKKRSIGYKRNKAVQAAKHDICVNMDDDDVYPETSFRRRVSWLLAYPEVKVAGCTMIAMYDLQHGISAVNTPPWALKQCERVSEASFCFWKSYAVEHPFPDQQQSEGEAFVPEDERFMEIPPQQVLVALNHGKNTSGRIIAGRAQTGCFWGWDRQFITWLHGLVGVQVEAV
jgi:glycosyltransferase involved in cell wall biosynthesis